jgi:hypothetical protein
MSIFMCESMLVAVGPIYSYTPILDKYMTDYMQVYINIYV